ncbi:hypothetical protein [Actinomadura litoris]|uniref:hypothetical protein n=1 Tax=Actinomadura litoris TaxID=2678616 RepID=UPI001FA764EE|nr:hypothetical protein [Actinomadura litoris]
MAPKASRAKQLADARLLLDWLEAHPEVPLPNLDLAAVLHMTASSADAVMTRAVQSTGIPAKATPVGGKVLRRACGSVSYRLVSLPLPPTVGLTRITLHHRSTTRPRKPRRRATQKGRARDE